MGSLALSVQLSCVKDLRLFIDSCEISEYRTDTCTQCENAMILAT
jgi:hypothetical protein